MSTFVPFVMPVAPAIRKSPTVIATPQDAEAAFGRGSGLADDVGWLLAHGFGPIVLGAR